MPEAAAVHDNDAPAGAINNGDDFDDNVEFVLLAH